MKNLSNSDELEQIIERLDNLLIEGHLKHVTQRQGYFQKKDKEGFDVEAYKKETVDILNEWFQTVVKVLDEQIKEKHHVFHFIQHKGSSMSLLGMPIELGNAFINFEYYLYALEDIILKLEERRNLLVRQEIAEKEYQTDILYKITYSEHTREIKLNNMVLARPQPDSKSANFFEYVYSHQNQQIPIKDIEEETAYELAESIQDILRDLGFKGNIRKVFFPVATKSKVMFVNPITKQYSIKNDLPAIVITKTTRQDEK